MIPSFPNVRHEEAHAITALSQHEQRQLEAIEEQLLQEDLKLARTLSVQRFHHRALDLAWFLGGIILLLTGAVASQLFLTAGVAVAVAGYVVMVGSVGRWSGRRSI